MDLLVFFVENRKHKLEAPSKGLVPFRETPPPFQDGAENKITVLKDRKKTYNRMLS